VICPFCGDDDFNAIGLKRHFLSRWCEVFNDTPAGDTSEGINEVGEQGIA